MNVNRAARLAGICAVLIIAWLLLKTITGKSPEAASHPPTISKRATAVADSRKGTSTSTRPEITAKPTLPPGENAADIYKNAYVLFKALSDEEKNILKHPRDEVDAMKAAALFKKIQPIIDLLRRAGTDAAYCDWALGPYSFTTPLPQVSLAMDLGRLARWDAAYRFSTANDPEGAVASLAASSQLGHNVADLLIGYLVDVSLNQGTFDLIRENAASLTPVAMQQALGLLRSFPNAADFEHGMEGETVVIRAMADALADPEKRAVVLEQFGQADDTGRKLLGADPSSIIPQMEWVDQVEKEFGKTAQLPDTEFNAWWNKVQAEAASKPFAALALPALNSTRDRMRATGVQQSMLIAGLGILQNGPGTAAAVLDPTTGRVFTYIETPTGFELRSPFQFKGKPITMSFTFPPR